MDTQNDGLEKVTGPFKNGTIVGIYVRFLECKWSCFLPSFRPSLHQLFLPRFCIASLEIRRSPWCRHAVQGESGFGMNWWWMLISYKCSIMWKKHEKQNVMLNWIKFDKDVI